MTLRPLVLASVVLLSAQIAFAQPANKTKLAFTDEEQAGVDYRRQGEYVGVVMEGGRRRRVALQVVARGDGKFEAVRLSGGLPGDGWDGGKRSGLSGEVGDNLLQLTGEGGTARIGDGVADLLNSDGQTLGRLKRVERVSPTMGAAPPAGAMVLFDGRDVNGLTDAKVTDGLLNIGFTTAEPVANFRLHLEFRTPFMPYARGQGRGNSGVYIQRRYEVQILDSFGLEGVANECGALYKQKRPDVNMCLPPLRWQTYDISFRAARWNDQNEKTGGARITVLHNGVKIHDDYEISNKTGAGRKESPEPLPIHFQNHGNPVHFRNLWVVKYEDAEPPSSLSDLVTGPIQKGAAQKGPAGGYRKGVARCQPRRWGGLLRRLRNR